VATATVTREELETILERVEEFARRSDDFRRRLDYITAEFATESGKGARSEVSDEELDAFHERLERLHDEDLVLTYLIVAGALHGHLSGKASELMAHLKAIFIEVAHRWIPDEPWRAGMAMWEGEEDCDLSYMEDEA
jgi:hypothetical protein